MKQERDSNGRFLKGRIAWNKDKSMVHSSSFKKGHKVSIEVRDKMRLAKIGKPSCRKGKTLSEKTKQKISEAHQGKHHSPLTQFKKGSKPWNKGKEFEFMINNQYAKGITPWNKGKTGVYSNEVINKIKKSRAKQVLPVKDTKIEVKIQDFIKSLGYDFFTHYYVKEIKHGYQCDILIPSLNLVVECDGDYWHKYPIGNELDHIRTKELFEKGFKVLRLWENEINNMDITEFERRIKCSI